MPEFLDSLPDNDVAWGSFKVVGVDDRGNTVSRRPKYIFVKFVPAAGISAIKRAKVLKIIIIVVVIIIMIIIVVVIIIYYLLFIFLINFRIDDKVTSRDLVLNEIKIYFLISSFMF